MLDLFSGLRRMLKRRYVTIDNAVFRLHWMITSLVLMAFSLVVTTRQYVGNPIECLKLGNYPSGFIDLYCWIHYTYTIPDAFGKTIGDEVPHPGIDNSKSGSGNKKYYAYYQWVCFVLFLQGVSFYAPYYLWSLWEGGLIKSVSLGMQIAITSEEEKKHKKKIITDYLVQHMGCHRWYALKYFFCELLCLVNVAGQIVLLNCLFDGDYLTYGIDVMRYAQTHLGVDPMAYVFPTMTKCSFRDFGTSGDVQRHDVLCILPVNVLNEKIYVFIWFWFVLLVILSTVVLLTRILVLIIPCTRQHFLHVRCKLALKDHINIIVKGTNIGDWFLLYMLSKNLDAIIFREVVYEMAKSLEHSKIEECEVLVA